MTSQHIQTLRQKILQQYDLESLSLELMGEKFQLRVVRDMDSLLEKLIAKGEDHEDVQDERIPYWADLWHAAIGLAEYVLASADIGPGVEVLELGCGLGLSGIAAGKKGARVLLTDYLSEALELAELLWWENLGTPAHCQRLDWRQIDPALQPDFVLAADVAYEERNFGPLLEAFSHFTQQGAIVLLSEPGRRFTQPFLQQLKDQFSVQTSTRTITYRDLTHKVSIYEVRKR